jgi:high-affinity nickel-transport protein
MAEMVDWGVIALMALVGVLNLRALRRPTTYSPVGWKQGLAPGLAKATHPLGVLAVGVVFGLVFDTASQAAAWGLAASASGGLREVLMLCLVFGAGMTLTDTVDSQLVARLLRRGGNGGQVQAYRRGVGWLIVALSLGMAGFALARKLMGVQDLPDMLLTALGLTMALAVVAMLLARRPKPAAS